MGTNFSKEVSKSALRRWYTSAGKENDAEPPDLTYIRYRPQGLTHLTEVTKFSRKELQLIYRCFKEGSPNGIVSREQFQDIYAHYFPSGDPSKYAVYVFNTFDRDKNGSVNFEEFVIGLSVLSRGTTQEKLRWVFELYDTDRDGKLTRGDIWRVVASIYEMLGASTIPKISEDTIDLHVDYVMEKMYVNSDDEINILDFLDACVNDTTILNSLELFTTRR